MIQVIVIQVMRNQDNKRAKIFESFGLDFLTYLLVNELNLYNKTISMLEAPFWKEAINSEIESIT